MFIYSNYEITSICIKVWLVDTKPNCGLSAYHKRVRLWWSEKHRRWLVTC